MFIPVYDQNPLRSIHFQVVTVSLIAINIVIFILQVTALPLQVVLGFALVPADLVGMGAAVPGAAPSVGEIAIPERLTLLSYMFFHGDILHLAGNMLFLWVFGDNVEDALGHFRFLIFYLACGVAGGLAHALMMPNSELPLIGASGAVAGVIAAYLMLHPRVRIWVLVMRFIPIRISAAFALGAWVVTQLVMAVLPQVGPVAWWAHVGGLAAGAVLVIFMRRSGVPLFDRGIA
ncbi:MAG TPA: rhomboid family intramembrane serine protease [Hyphomicrobiaceae bacterium]|nr:MAG: rhomboid family intramembrane serine protease [Pseudomonadota bacterium]HEX5600617.1 rhomboid family intramembrane serine protease [Hyphomicrobiaceae bacterium]